MEDQVQVTDNHVAVAMIDHMVKVVSLITNLVKSCPATPLNSVIVKVVMFI